MKVVAHNQQQAFDYARQRGPFRPCDVADLGVHPEDTRRLCRKRLLTRISRGL